MITKDADFVDSHLLRARPAKLLLVSMGNISNAELELLMVRLIPNIMRELTNHDFLELGSAGFIIRG